MKFSGWRSYRICFLFYFIYFITFQVYAQQFPGTPVSTWAEAGMKDSVPNYETVLNVIDFGADSTGQISSNEAVNVLLASIEGPTVIFFPRGKYFFDQAIILDNFTTIRGEGAGKTILEFDLNNAITNLIQISGRSFINDTLHLKELKMGSYELELSQAAELLTWRDVYLTFIDTSLMTSTWAYGSAGGLYEVQEMSADKLLMESSIRIDVKPELLPIFLPVEAIRGVGLECFSIVRRDSTAFQASNISFNFAKDCWVIGVESQLTNFAHIEINRSSNLLIRGNYLHEAHAYGGGGQGYGLLLQFGSAHVLAENNIFRKLRHSILLQAGANTNVISYNYSIEPFWTGTALPSNSAGDLVCHGNYPYFNLFEGNIAQNIVVDASHGKNGPHNIFLRNRADSYGIFMSPGSGTDSTHFVGNEVSNTGFLMGLYSLIGEGNITFGNRIRGQLQPAGTTGDFPDSYYLTSLPGFWDNEIWPRIGEQLPGFSSKLPAVSRWETGEFTDCTRNPIYEDETVRIDEQKLKPSFLFYPNPVISEVKFSWEEYQRLVFTIFDSRGKAVVTRSVSGEVADFDMTGLSDGMYFVQIRDAGGNLLEVVKLIKY